jgi:hypothetical protein
MPSKKQFPRTGEMSYRPVGRSGRHKLVPVMVKPEPSVVKQPTEHSTLILIAPPRVDSENPSYLGAEAQDYENLRWFV